MSKFNAYAKRLNEAAKAAFEEYQKAEKAYNDAEEATRRLPWDATREQKLLTEAAVVKAREGLKTAKEALYAGRRKMDEIRKVLVWDLEKAYVAKPEDIDPNTLELIKSGILRPEEYVSLANKAIANGNNTMLRIIGANAEKLADNLRDDKTATEMRGALYAVSTRAKGSTGAEELGRYDALVHVYDRCTNNPGIIGKWDMLTEAEINNF